MTQEVPRSHLHRLLQAGEFVVTAELQTSDSADPARIAELAGTLRQEAAKLLTDQPGRRFRLKAIGGGGGNVQVIRIGTP